MNNKEQDFLKVNFDNKILRLQDEHKIVLQILYKDACERRIIQDFRLRGELSDVGI